jgi:hypothetical protein
MPTQMLTIAVLNDVGKAPICLPLNAELFPPAVVRRCAASMHREGLSISDSGELRLAGGDDAWATLREFLGLLLVRALDCE